METMRNIFPHPSLWELCKRISGAFEVTINVYQELKSKEGFKTLVLHFVCTRGGYKKALLYLTSNSS